MISARWFDPSKCFSIFSERTGDTFEDHGHRRLARQAALGPVGAQTNRGERALDGVGRAYMLPVLGGEVVERQQDVAVPGQAGRGLVVLRPVGFQEEVEGALGILPGFGHPDVLQAPLGFLLQTLGQLVQDVARLVNPAALLAGAWVDLAERLPEAERAVAERQLSDPFQGRAA